MNRRNAWIIIPISLLAGLAVLAWQNAVRRQMLDQPPGRLTRRDILYRAAVLKQLSLLPAATRDTVSREETRYHNGRMKLFWTVDCWEAPRRFAAHVQWDADTGDLRILSRRASASPFPLPDLTRKEATARLWRLLKQPGIGRPGEQWQLTSAPIITGADWRFSIKCAQRIAYVQVDSHTGQVTYVRVIDRPTAFRSHFSALR